MTIGTQRVSSGMRTLTVLFVLAAMTLIVIATLPLGDDEIARAVVILCLLVVISLVVFARAEDQNAGGQALLAVLFVSFALKLLAMGFRFSVGLLADAYVYEKAGYGISELISQGLWPASERVWGTSFVRLLVGIVYFVTGRTFYGISILWTWLALLGMFFFYRAFVTAFPSGNRRLYMLLLFFYPSMLLWTSSLGKDALVVFCLGMAAYGAARTIQRIDFTGLFSLGLGMSGMLMIRPHIAAVFAVALAGAVLLRPIRAGPLTPVIRIVGAVFFIAISVMVVRTASGFVGIDSVTTEEVLGFIDVRRERTTRGGSAFQQVNPRSPAGLLIGIPTVLFRPFPWEAHRTYALFSAVEGMAILAFVVGRWRSVVTALAESRRNGFLALILVYSVLFIFFFSAIGNFGIIARQRVQLLPFVLMLVAYLGARQRASAHNVVAAPRSLQVAVSPAD